MNNPKDTTLPKNMSICVNDDKLNITLTWFGLSLCNFILQAILAVSMSTITLSTLINFESVSLSTTIIFIAISVCSTYQAIATWLNKTTINVTKNRISIIHEPIPWPGKKSFNGKDIKQVYIKEKKTVQNGIAYYSYDIYIIPSKAPSTLLLKNLTKDRAQYIEQEIEKFLNIEDKTVYGEI